MAKNNSGLGCLIAFVMLGFFLLFYNRIMIFSPFFMTLMVGVIALGVLFFVIGIKSSLEGNPPFNKIKSLDNYQRTPINPYIQQNNKNTLQHQVIQKEVVKKKPIISNYCQFCGERREKDAIYCHNCGTKLDLD